MNSYKTYFRSFRPAKPIPKGYIDILKRAIFDKDVNLEQQVALLLQFQENIKNKQYGHSFQSENFFIRFIDKIIDRDGLKGHAVSLIRCAIETGQVRESYHNKNEVEKWLKKLASDLASASDGDLDKAMLREVLYLQMDLYNEGWHEAEHVLLPSLEYFSQHQRAAPFVHDCVAGCMDKMLEERSPSIHSRVSNLLTNIAVLEGEASSPNLSAAINPEVPMRWIAKSADLGFDDLSGQFNQSKRDLFHLVSVMASKPYISMDCFDTATQADLAVLGKRDGDFLPLIGLR